MAWCRQILLTNSIKTYLRHFVLRILFERLSQATSRFLICFSAALLWAIVILLKTFSIEVLGLGFYQNSAGYFVSLMMFSIIWSLLWIITLHFLQIEQLVLPSFKKFWNCLPSIAYESQQKFQAVFCRWHDLLCVRIAYQIWRYQNTDGLNSIIQTWNDFTWTFSIKLCT